MHEQAPATHAVQRPADLLVSARQIDFGRVLRHDHDLFGADPLQGGIAMRPQHLLRRHALVIEKSIGALRLRQSPTRGGNAQGRLVRQAVEQQREASIQTLVAEVRRPRLLRNPCFHWSSP